MAVVALKDGYTGEVRDRVENFHGNWVTYLHWEDHLSFCAALAFPFPGSEEAARRQAVTLLNAPQGQALLAQLRRHAQAVALAWQSGIEKLPAVLVDQRYVVYGAYDVQAALARVARFREEAVRAQQAREPSVRLEQVRKALATEMRASYAD